jgi:hypothetical protein
MSEAIRQIKEFSQYIEKAARIGTTRVGRE